MMFATLQTNKKKLFAHVILSILFVGVLVFSLLQSYRLANKNKELIQSQKVIQNNQLQNQTTNNQKPQVASVQKSLDYCEEDRNIGTELNRGKAYTVSYLFGFRINPFHKDWECDNGRFTPDGLLINCSQKGCSSNTGFPQSRETSPACSQELSSRELPPSSISLFTISVSEYNVDPKIGKPTIKGSGKTPKKEIAYELIKNSKSNYESDYVINFYSEKKLGDSFSQYTGEYFGEDVYYAKYSIKATIFGDLVSEKKLINLIEKLIDSIEFIPANN